MLCCSMLSKTAKKKEGRILQIQTKLLPLQDQKEEKKRFRVKTKKQTISNES